MYAIIGGSGLAKLAELSEPKRRVVRTPYGDPSCALTFGQLDGTPVCFLARHGYGHTLAPHEINYRANLTALQDVGVSQIVAVAAVGSLRTEWNPGTLVVPDQIIDYTYGRKNTFFEGAERSVRHVDFTHPYDSDLRHKLLKAAQAANIATQQPATYGCTQGPRLETAAEIARMRRDGCDLVGMTGMPEALLARELDIPYVSLAVVANHAAGIGQSTQGVSVEAMGAVLNGAMAQARRVLVQLMRQA
jgi:5'-methylthioinosine phosphorylase